MYCADFRRDHGDQVYRKLITLNPISGFQDMRPSPSNKSVVLALKVRSLIGVPEYDISNGRSDIVLREKVSVFCMVSRNPYMTIL